MAIDLTDGNFYSTLQQGEGVSVVQFTAPWCAPCRMITPRLQEFSEDLSINYYKVNIDEQTELARDFRVMSIPTLLWWKNGNLVKRTVGVVQYKELKEIVEAL